MHTTDRSLEKYEGSEFNEWAFDVVAEGLSRVELGIIDDAIPRGGKVLEVGCGGGRICLALAKRGYDMYGLDFSERLVAAAKSNLREVVDADKIRHGDARRLPFEPKNFDAVLLLGNIVNFITQQEGRIQAIAEAHRVLVCGGIAIFSSLEYRRRLLNYLISVLQRAFRSRDPDLTAQHLPWLKSGRKLNLRLFSLDQAFVYWYRRDELLSEIEANGFTIVEVIDNEKNVGNGHFFVVARK